MDETKPTSANYFQVRVFIDPDMQPCKVKIDQVPHGETATVRITWGEVVT